MQSKNVTIIVEDDVLNRDLYIGRSGDFTIINHFFSSGFNVILVTASSMQCREFNFEYNFEAFVIDNIKFQQENVYERAVYQEYLNISSNKQPSHGIAENLMGQITMKRCDISSIASIHLLISRVMPQSLSQNFARNFVEISKRAEYVPQDISQICLYKDKAIPYLLQNNNIAHIYKEYSQELACFKAEVKGDYSHLAIETIMLDSEQHFDDILKDIEQIPYPLCVKPFNLFGGIGVGIVQSIDGIHKHISKIHEVFEKYAITEKRLILVQKAVNNPEFGDIRAFFSHGKFIGAFKRFEPINQIHNTINGALIIPICDENLNFAHKFEENLHEPFRKAIEMITSLFTESSFLKSEFICGCDFLLDVVESNPIFKLTELNIACPTGFAFLEATLQYIKHGKCLKFEHFLEYFAHNKTIIGKVFHC